MAFWAIELINQIVIYLIYILKSYSVWDNQFYIRNKIIYKILFSLDQNFLQNYLLDSKDQINYTMKSKRKLILIVEGEQYCILKNFNTFNY